MKRLELLTATIFISSLLLSCGGDDDDDNNDLPPEFTNQTLQGKINGTDWTAGSGLAGPSPFEDNMLSVEIAGTEIENVCDEFFLEGLKVIFSAPDAVGLYDLEFGSQTVTLFDPDGTLNVIIVDGALEIQTIDATDGGTVTGRIVGESDGDNFIDGNFTVAYCPE